MLQPKRTKYRRSQKGRMRGNAQRGHELAFGSFGIKALENMWIEQRQIEAARVAVTRYMQRQGQIWIRIFPDKPITKKPAEVRMGKGKGSPEGFVAPVTPGRILFEADGVPYAIAKEALRLAAQKLPIATKFVVKDLTTEEIKEKIETEKAALTKMKMNHAVSPLENPMLIRTTRRNIARLMTELRKRELNK